MKTKELMNYLNSKEQLLVKEFLKNPINKTQFVFKTIKQWKDIDLKIESLQWLENRINKLKNFKNSTRLEAQILRHGEELGTQKYQEALEKNRKANRGTNNAMSGLSMIQRMKNKYGADWEQYYKKWRENQKHFGSDNVAFGKTNKDFLINAWIKQGLTQEEAEEKYKLKCEKHSQPGEKNGMYGKPSPYGSGSGIGGWYKWKYYFRSLHELSYIIYLEENNIPFVSAEDKISIPYLENRTKRTYKPDFIINQNEVIEVKPEKLYRHNKLKFEAGKKWCDENNYKFLVITPELIKKDKLISLINKGDVVLNKKYKDLYK